MRASASRPASTAAAKREPQIRINNTDEPGRHTERTSTRSMPASRVGYRTDQHRRDACRKVVETPAPGEEPAEIFRFGERSPSAGWCGDAVTGHDHRPRRAGKIRWQRHDATGGHNRPKQTAIIATMMLKSRQRAICRPIARARAKATSKAEISIRGARARQSRALYETVRACGRNRRTKELLPRSAGITAARTKTSMAPDRAASSTTGRASWRPVRRAGLDL